MLKRALEIGLVNEVVNDEELEKTILSIAKRLTKGPAGSYAIAKDNLNRAMLTLLETQLEQERPGNKKANQTRDAHNASNQC